MARSVPGSVMKATMRIRVAQSGQSSGKTSQMRASSCAQA